MKMKMKKRLPLAFYKENGTLRRKVVHVSDFKAMLEVENVFDIKGAMRKKLISVGEGIMISEPLIVEKELRVGGLGFPTSLSH